MHTISVVIVTTNFRLPLFERRPPLLRTTELFEQTECLTEECFALNYLKIQSVHSARICPHKLQLGIAASYLNVDFLRQQCLFFLFFWQFIHLIGEI